VAGRGLTHAVIVVVPTAAGQNAGSVEPFRIRAVYRQVRMLGDRFIPVLEFAHPRTRDLDENSRVARFHGRWWRAARLSSTDAARRGVVADGL
jgi:hypothetical protein